MPEMRIIGEEEAERLTRAAPLFKPARPFPRFRDIYANYWNRRRRFPGGAFQGPGNYEPTDSFFGLGQGEGSPYSEQFY